MKNVPLVSCAILVLSLLLRAALALPSAQQPRNARAILTEPPPPFDQKIAYGSDPLQFGELRLPHNPGIKKPYPVAIIFHGGCWLSEYGLGYMGHLSADLAPAGVATWNVEYRRVGDSGGAWPGTFEDAGRAVDFVRTLARSYPLDLKRVIAVGHSAGGHLALWVAARHKLPKDNPIYVKDALPLLGVVALAGITDLRRTGTACDVEVGKLMKGSADSQPAIYDLASPLSLLPLGVRQTIVQGDSDRIIPPVMATAYVDAARQKGDPVRLAIIEKAGHFELVDPKSPAWTSVRQEVLSLLNTGN